MRRRRIEGRGAGRCLSSPDRRRTCCTQISHGGLQAFDGILPSLVRKRATADDAFGVANADVEARQAGPSVTARLAASSALPMSLEANGLLNIEANHSTKTFTLAAAGGIRRLQILGGQTKPVRLRARTTIAVAMWSLVRLHHHNAMVHRLGVGLSDRCSTEERSAWPKGSSARKRSTNKATVTVVTPNDIAFWWLAADLASDHSPRRLFPTQRCFLYIIIWLLRESGG